MSTMTALILTVILLALNALFVAAEFALIAARITQIEPHAQHSRAARLTVQMMRNVTTAMAAAQMGITICSLGLGAISEPAIAHLLEPLFEEAGLPQGAVHPVALVIALSLIVFLHVVLGEMVPKNLALAGPERAALALGPFMYGVVALFRPLVGTLNWVANVAVRLMGVQPVDEVAASFTHDEVAGLVEESRREGLLDDDEYGLVTGALDFTGGTVAQVLLPMEHLVTMTPSSTLSAVEEACASTGFSRYPVADGAGGLSGYLHVKDVLDGGDDRDRPLSREWILRPLATVEPLTTLFDALRTMQARGSHVARVADAAGTTLGAVMLEDVLEELVGEVRSQR